MSFYCGGPNKILHITKGQQSSMVLSGAPIKDTVFHSDLNYVFIKHIYTSSVFNYQIPGTNEYGLTTRFTVDAYTKSLMGSFLWFLIDSSGLVMQHCLEIKANGLEPSNNTTPQVSGWLDGGLTYQAVKLIIVSGVRGRFGSAKADASIGVCRICITNVLASGSIEEVTKTETDIFISRYAINIKGVPFLQNKYLSTNVVNPYDITGTIGAKTFQILNSISTPGELELYSNPSGSGIKKGGHVYVDSNISENMEILHAIPFVANFTGLTNIVHSYAILNLPEPIPANSIAIISWADPYGRNVCYVTTAPAPNVYLIGQDLVYRPYVTGDSDLLRVGVAITTTQIIAEVYYYKRVYVNSKGYYPNDAYSLSRNMVCTIIGN